jgi:hypothetical protein
MKGVTLVAAGLGVFALWRARGLAALVVAFYVLHALQPHKELRFLIPILPLFAALAGVGLDSVLRDWKTYRIRAALAVLVVTVGMGSAVLAPNLTFGAIGQYEQTRPQVSAYDDSGPINRLLEAAGQQQDVCGLKIEASAHLAWTGGYSYFHRQVPLYWFQGPDRGTRLFNYVIAARQVAFGGQEVAQDEGSVLLRLPVPSCAPDPGYSWRLP